VSVRNVEWGEPLLERLPDPELEAIARRGGRVQGGMAYFTAVPWVYLALVRLNQRLMSRMALDHDLADLAGLVVSQDNSCRYCYAVQRALLQLVGFADERIAKLEETFLLAELGPRERAALEFARRVSRSNPLVGARDLESLRRHGFSELEIQELASIAALNVLFNRSSTIPAIPAKRWEELPDRWTMQLLKPLMSVYVKRRVRGRDEARRLSDDQRSGPFSYLTNALDGHPFAGELRLTLDEMWRSEHLGRRAKALCFAVVARALGCGRAEQEATSLACEQGLSPEQMHEVLANLSSPVLDETERVLVPFSRQTVWYQVPDLQRRSREVSEALDPEAFLEAIMVTSLANVVARLGFLAEAR